MRRWGTALRFATVAVNQGGCRTRRKPNLRAIFQRVTVLNGWRDDPRCHEPVQLTNPAVPDRARGNELGDNPTMGSDYNTLPRLDSPDVPAEVVFQFAYASLHVPIIATVATLGELPLKPRPRYSVGE